MIPDTQARLDMIVKFSTSFGRVTMHGDAAVALLKGMGHSGPVPGAILTADLPVALAQLQRMLETSGDSTGAPWRATGCSCCSRPRRVGAST
jgi:hypothetical protein